MPTALLLFAQTASADPLSGGAGWVGAGLLGCVLAWLLLRHLPEKDRQFTELIGRQDAAARQDRAEFRATLREVLAHCEAENTELAERLAAELRHLADEVHALRGHRQP